MLEFDEAAHRYLYKGKPVPGVTSLLTGMHSFLGVPRDVLEAARKRGSAVHKACELYDLGDLDEDALRADMPAIVPYFEAWKRFTLDCDTAWLHIEEPVYCHAHGFAGTPDRFGGLWLEGQFIEFAQVDIKTAEVLHPVWGLQTAAYNRAREATAARRFTCQLLRDGTYRLREWQSPNDWTVFLSLLNVHHWKEAHA